MGGVLPAAVGWQKSSGVSTHICAQKRTYPQGFTKVANCRPQSCGVVTQFCGTRTPNTLLSLDRLNAGQAFLPPPPQHAARREISVLFLGMTFHTHAAIVSIGDELTLGQSLDTNSMWLAERLMALGISTVEHVTIGDDTERNAAAFARLAASAPLVISTGGLGPTLDDLTRQALAALLNEPLITDPDALADLERRFAARRRSLNDLQRSQALRPRSARCLPNPNGTAPGLHAAIDLPPQRWGGGGRNAEAASSRFSEREGVESAFPPHASSDIFCLPGPPNEMKPMFEACVVPLLRPAPGRVIRTRFLQVIGIGEGDAASAVANINGKDLMRRDRNPLVGITASGAQLTWRIRSEGTASAAAAEAALDQTEAAIRGALGAHVFASGEVTLAGAVLKELGRRTRTLGAVESCTGGMLGELITAEPGSSSVFRGGLVTYSNELKTALADVPPAILAAHGAVSRETAEAMAEGGLTRLGVDECLAITGIAGPGGGSEAKPVGTVYIALASRGGGASGRPGGQSSAGAPNPPNPRVTGRRFLIPGDREDIRLRAARTGLGMLWLSLAGALGGRPLLFERAG